MRTRPGNFAHNPRHVILARALLYRIGEDQGIFPRLLSGEQMDKELSAPRTGVVDSAKPATDLLFRVQDSMREFLPAVYELGEFDWWQVRSDKRPVLSRAELAWLRLVDDEFERTAKRLLRVLDGYFFGRVQRRRMAQRVSTLFAASGAAKAGRVLHA